MNVVRNRIITKKSFVLVLSTFDLIQDSVTCGHVVTDELKGLVIRIN